jgi:hypothetical protein
MANSAVVALLAKSGTPDLGIGWEPIPATTLAIVVPCQIDRKVGIGKAAWWGTTGNAQFLVKVLFYLSLTKIMF